MSSTSFSSYCLWSMSTVQSVQSSAVQCPRYVSCKSELGLMDQTAIEVGARVDTGAQLASHLTGCTLCTLHCNDTDSGPELSKVSHTRRHGLSGDTVHAVHRTQVRWNKCTAAVLQDNGDCPQPLHRQHTPAAPEASDDHRSSCHGYLLETVTILTITINHGKK